MKSGQNPRIWNITSSLWFRHRSGDYTFTLAPLYNTEMQCSEQMQREIFIYTRMDQSLLECPLAMRLCLWFMSDSSIKVSWILCSVRTKQWCSIWMGCQGQCSPFCVTDTPQCSNVTITVMSNKF